MWSIKEAFRAVTEGDILQPYISDLDFRSSNHGTEVCYNFYVFDIRYGKNFTAAKPINVEFRFEEVVPADVKGYALVLTNKLITCSSNGQRSFDLF